MITALVAAAALAVVPPEKPIGPGDDFNEMVARGEKETKCEAIRVFKGDPDAMRFVMYRCEKEDRIYVLIYEGEAGWFVMGQVSAPREKASGSAI